MSEGERPWRVAVVGAGPSGFYAVQALQASKLPMEIDLLDRLPTPFGLVRAGVAPDHQNIKAVVKAYEKIAAQPGFRFRGSVSLGSDVTIDELLASYDQVVLAVGCEHANPLGVPGEELPGSHAAAAFVGWYNGHPDHVDHDFELDATTAVVVGVGNVAMDVSRLLVGDRDLLARTDIAHHALEALRASHVRDVYVLGRRGAAQVAFTPGELQELDHLPDVDVRVRPEDVELDPDSAAFVASAKDKALDDNLRLLREIAARGPRERSRRIHLWLNTSPVALEGTGRVERMVVARNRVEGDGSGGFRAVDTGERATIPAGLVFRAVGYRARPLPGVPFDARNGTIANVGGRVADRLYCVGWAKRGPKGLIGTNRADSRDTVERMLEDLRTLPVVERPRVVRIETGTDWQDWKHLDAHEQAVGQEKGKLREKVVRVPTMHEILDKNPDRR
jgi:ferredoxin--NADP+ reductase